MVTKKYEISLASHEGSKFHKLPILDPNYRKLICLLQLFLILRFNSMPRLLHEKDWNIFFENGNAESCGAKEHRIENYRKFWFY